MKRKMTGGMAPRTDLRKGPRYRIPKLKLLRTCAICADDLPDDAFPTEPLSDNCKHDQAACLECIQEDHQYQIHARRTTVRCPECGAVMDFERVKKFTDSSSFEKWDELLVRKAIREDLFVHCPHPNCEAGQIHEPGEVGCEHPNLTKCWSCKKEYCAGHGRDCHHNLTCNEFDMVLDGPDAAQDSDEYNRLVNKMDAATAEYVKDSAVDRAQAKLSEQAILGSTQPCPNADCQSPMVFVGGCRTVQCPECETWFCWACRSILARPSADHTCAGKRDEVTPDMPASDGIRQDVDQAEPN